MKMDDNKHGLTDPFRSADDVAEAFGQVVETVVNGVEDSGADVPGLSAATTGIDLLYDPARFQRSPQERQQRLVKQVAVLIANFIGLAWCGLLAFTIADTLRTFGLIVAVPRFLREVVPDWYGGHLWMAQLLLLAALAAVGAGFVFICIRLLVSVGLSSLLTPAFEMRVADDEFVSRRITPELLGLSEEAHKTAIDAVYTSIYLASAKANREDFAMLESLLSRSDEGNVVVFLKSKVRRYPAVMHREADKFCEKSRRLMAAIGVSPID
ncbi:MAG TPA: hypothetical protein VGQ46_02360 [Thermoanaerobaculia bacterium]|jgi:hypothetical protein|nr:hypothetical protein [Thermoanaerobaculia bacterium]